MHSQLAWEGMSCEPVTIAAIAQWPPGATTATTATGKATSSASPTTPPSTAARAIGFPIPPAPVSASASPGASATHAASRAFPTIIDLTHYVFATIGVTSISSSYPTPTRACESSAPASGSPLALSADVRSARMGCNRRRLMRWCQRL